MVTREGDLNQQIIMAHSDSWSSLSDSQSGHRSSNLLCATKGLNDEYRDTQMLLVVKIDKQDNQSWSSNGMPRGQLWVCGGTGRHASLKSQKFLIFW